MLINPAYVGSEAQQKFTTMGRIFNFKSSFSPNTIEASSGLISYEHDVKSIKISFGFLSYNDKIGATIDNRYSLLYTYTFTMKDSSSLRIGTNLSFDRKTIDFSQYIPIDPNDPILISDNAVSSSKANVGMGIWYTRKKFFTGVSVDYLNEPKFNFSTDLSTSYKRNYQIVAGFNKIKLTKHLATTHSFFFRTDGKLYDADLNNILIVKNILMLGATYRILSKDLKENLFLINGGLKLADKYQIVFKIYSQKPAFLRSAFSGEALLSIAI